MPNPVLINQLSSNNENLTKIEKQIEKRFNYLYRIFFQKFITYLKDFNYQVKELKVDGNDLINKISNIETYIENKEKARNTHKKNLNTVVNAGKGLFPNLNPVSDMTETIDKIDKEIENSRNQLNDFVKYYNKKVIDFQEHFINPNFYQVFRIMFIKSVRNNFPKTLNLQNRKVEIDFDLDDI